MVYDVNGNRIEYSAGSGSFTVTAQVSDNPAGVTWLHADHPSG